MSFTLVVFSTSAVNSGVAIKPRVIKSSDEYPVGSRGSLMASGSHGPPCGLKTPISYPRSENQKYGCVSSLHQKPTGHPVVVEVAGFEMTIATRFRDLGFTTFGSLMLMRTSPARLIQSFSERERCALASHESNTSRRRS